MSSESKRHGKITETISKSLHRYRRIVAPLLGISLLCLYLGYRNEIDNFYNRRLVNSITLKGNVNASENITPAQKLEREVRILCWIMTTPANHKTRAIHVRKTWGKRCNRLLFVTSQHDEELGETFLPNTEDIYDKLWNKTILAFEHVYRTYGNEADWFMKADDDTFVFVENLRYFLYPYSPEMPIYFGYNFKYNNNTSETYMSGGSGYVLSKGALRRFIEEAIPDSTKCDTTNPLQAEDVAIGKCLAAVGVAAGDSRDVHNQNRFFPFGPYTALMSNYFPKDLWFYSYAYYHVRACQDCLSKYAVAFHYVSSEEMYIFDFFSYQFEADGLDYSSPNELPKKLSAEEVLIPLADNSIYNMPAE